MTAVRGIVQKQSTFETKVIHFLVHLMFPASSKFMKLKFSIFRGILVIQKNNLFDVTIIVLTYRLFFDQILDPKTLFEHRDSDNWISEPQPMCFNELSTKEHCRLFVLS